MKPKRTASYAVACSFGDDDEFEPVFFVKFHTDNEDEARTLARCISTENCDKTLLVLDDDGGIW